MFQSLKEILSKFAVVVERADSKHLLRELPGRKCGCIKLHSGPCGNREAEITLYMKEKQSWYVKMQAVCFNEEAGFGFTPCSYLKGIEKCKS